MSHRPRAPKMCAALAPSWSPPGSALFGQRQYRNTLSERTTDLQLSYAFTDTSRLKGLSLLFQVNNLTDEPFRTEVSESTGTGLFFPEEYTQYGRQYMLGFRYEL